MTVYEHYNSSQKFDACLRARQQMNELDGLHGCHAQANVFCFVTQKATYFLLFRVQADCCFRYEKDVRNGTFAIRDVSGPVQTAVLKSSVAISFVVAVEPAPDWNILALPRFCGSLDVSENSFYGYPVSDFLSFAKAGDYFISRNSIWSRFHHEVYEISVGLAVWHGDGVFIVIGDKPEIAVFWFWSRSQCSDWLAIRHTKLFNNLFHLLLMDQP